MKVTIAISKTVVFSIILLFLGLIVLIKGISSIYKYHHALNITELDEAACENDTYVIGEITSCLTIEIKTSGSNVPFGQSETYLTGTKEYTTYTIPIADNRYMRILVAQKDTREAMDGLVKGKVDKVSFEGVVCEPISDLNEEWYAQIPDFDSNAVLEEYVLKEIDYDREKRKALIGLSFLLTAMLLYWNSSRIEIFDS